MIKIALTGGIATGKSFVLARCAQLGLPTIDADTLAREAARPGAPASTEIRARFGDEVFAADGTLDRSKLGTKVFADPVARQDLEAILHPRVYRAIHEWFAGLESTGGHAAAIADIPLLYETGHEGDFDRVIVAACSPETQIRRIVARDGISESDALQRLTAQWPTAKKTARADSIIWTEGSLAETHEQIDLIYKEFGLQGSESGP